ncbi:enoyl-CoA hydratase/isomerase family protein [Pseudonocardia sp. MH-G8]|uniref:enoyl-CoA hydratase/isomerase family protein n=1 Tax=Pseudonocardia sp. MH-G8 TaxID=1854588 RepID=UPI000B9FE6C8|nr:enoyl-CoA hydratase/isomerase family protein [Pseudonocardia sp. MH-G8]OZM78282.1 enoyl-CoA hydratase [Pseudonocardia sp. MH-G8]
MTTATVDPELLQRGGLTLDVDGPRATITLARPEVLNAQTPPTWEAFRTIGEALPEQVRVVVVRGAGRAFSAGLDRRFFAAQEVEGAPGLSAIAALPDDDADATIAGFQLGFSWLREPGRVTVAAVQGHAIGAGFQLALSCDLRVVADDVQFCMAEPGLGIVPDLGGTYPLVHAVGYARAVEICLSGRRIGAEEAVATGLALRAVPTAELDDAVDALAASLVVAPPKAATETLALLAGVAEGADPAAALAAERAAQLRRLRSLAAGEG